MHGDACCTLQFAGVTHKLPCWRYEPIVIMDKAIAAWAIAKNKHAGLLLTDTFKQIARHWVY